MRADRRATAVLGALLLLLAACGSGARGEDERLLDRYGELDLIVVPGTTEVGRARDKGGDPGLTGPPAALVVALASPLPLEEQVEAYRQRYGEQYALNPFGLPSATRSELLGRLSEPAGTVKVVATADPPQLPQGARPTTAPAGTRSWLTLRLQVP